MTRVEIEIQANVLLTVPLGSRELRSEKTLTPTEYQKLQEFLAFKKATIADLLESNGSALLEGLQIKNLQKKRVENLLKQGTALAISVEKWERAGLWIISPLHEDYPQRYLEKFREKTPPIIFGAGSRKILNKRGIAIVGSRSVSRENEILARSLGELASTQGYSVISGGAKGVDELSMRGAIDKEGQIVGVMTANLLRSAVSKKYRSAIARGDLTLISMINPETGFSVGAAMKRNKYIYALSEMAIAVCSTIEKGGTWTGAIENLKNEWVPLFLGSNKESGSGNEALVNKGGHWLPSLDEINFDKLIDASNSKDVNFTEEPSQLSFGI